MRSTSSLPRGSVTVAVFTMGWSTPSISTQLPAGTRFTSMWYLKGRRASLQRLLQPGSGPLQHCPPPYPWQQRLQMTFLPNKHIARAFHTLQLRSRDVQQCRSGNPPHPPGYSFLQGPSQAAQHGWYHWALCQRRGTEHHRPCCTFLLCDTSADPSHDRERQKKNQASFKIQSRNRHRPGRTHRYKGIIGWNLEILLLTCQVLHFHPLEALHLLALYGDPWNDFGGLF